MKLKKISKEHYIICDDSEIKEGDWIYNAEREPSILKCVGKGSLMGWQKITDSTQPLGWLNEYGFTTANLKPDWTNVQYLPLSEVKELLGVVDVEKKAFELAILFHNTYEKLAPAFGYETRLDTKVFDKNSANGKLMIAVCKEIYQALEDNKEKKYTEEDIRKTWEAGMRFIGEDKGSYGEFIQSLQPKTEWEVEFVDGKLKIKK